jgi:pyruvate kinase
MSDAVQRAVRIAREEGFARPGDVIVVAGGIPFGEPGTTNSLRVATVK